MAAVRRLQRVQGGIACYRRIKTPKHWALARSRTKELQFTTFREQISLLCLYFFANHCYVGLGPLGMLRNIPSPLGWGNYVTNAQPPRVGELRNSPSPPPAH
jgi:hypothetical protein